MRGGGLHRPRRGGGEGRDADGGLGTGRADPLFGGVLQWGFHYRVAGYEVRSAAFLHWWTFLGFFMEIRDSVYATVLALRQKRARGEKLEKWEQDFWRRNAGICRLKPRLSDAEKAEKERLEAALGRQGTSPRFV